MEEIKDYFLMERKLVRNLTPMERLVYLEFCERARWNGNAVNKLGLDLPKGGFIFGRKELCKRVGGTPQQVRTAIKNLTKNQLIANQGSTKRGSVFCLCKLGTILQPLTKNQPRTNQEPTTNIPIPEPIPVKHKKGASVQPTWEELRPEAETKMLNLFGFTKAFFDEQWEALMAYDRDKPYKNRRSGIIGWFTNNITKQKWKKFQEQASHVEVPLMEGFMRL